MPAASDLIGFFYSYNSLRHGKVFPQDVFFFFLQYYLRTAWDAALLRIEIISSRAVA